MQYNFCCDGLVSVISSSKSSFDGYDVTNLIEQNGLGVKEGFIADHFVKPPVSIIVKFVYAVDISHVVIKTFVGSQRSIKFDIFTKGRGQKGRVCSTAEINNADYIVFYKVGNNPPTPLNNRANVMKIPFHSPFRLKDVEQFIVTILKTSNSSVPCLGQLEVWGSPSKSISKQMVCDINKIWSSLKESQTVKVKNTNIFENTEDKKIAADFCVNKEALPEEFIDPITFEVMLCPMVLPCGKIVDKTTLDKFYAAEEEWGRGRSDPFTGLLFSDVRKPILDSILKSKIDKFLIFNCESDTVKKMPRIIGKKPVSSVPGISALFVKDTKSQPCSENTNICSSSTHHFHGTASYQWQAPIKRNKRSLDELISESLSGLPSYLKTKTPKIPPKEECTVCQGKSLLFKSPCSHLICRLCLLKTFSAAETYNCKTCGQSFNKNDPYRYHNV